jgi:hypothetical protein
MNSRIERDSFGNIEVPTNHFWGARTQRSLLHFHISTERMPEEIIFALAEVKLACARVNCDLGLLKAEKAKAIIDASSDTVWARSRPFRVRPLCPLSRAQQTAIHLGVRNGRKTARNSAKPDCGNFIESAACWMVAVLPSLRTVAQERAMRN